MVSSPPSGRMPPPWGRCTGTPWKAWIREGSGLAVGTFTNCARIQDWYVRYALMAVRGSAKWRRWAVSSRNTRSTSIRIGCVTATCAWKRLLTPSVGRTSTWGPAPSRSTRSSMSSVGSDSSRTSKHIRDSIIKLVDDIPVLIRHIANVSLGPAARRGALDSGGTESVGGVVVVRYGENPLDVIRRSRQKIEEISLGLPKRTLADGTVSQVRYRSVLRPHRPDSRNPRHTLFGAHQ